MGAGQPPQEKPLAETFDLVFKGGTLVNHAGEGLADIGVRDGRIAEIGSIGEGMAGETIDASGLHILPGTIDTPQNREAMPKADFSTWVAPEDIAHVIAFLLSDEARSVTGAAVPVYGRS